MLPTRKAGSCGLASVDGEGRLSSEAPSRSEKKSKCWQQEQRERHQGKSEPEDGATEGEEGHVRKGGGRGEIHKQQPAEIWGCSGKMHF